MTSNDPTPDAARAALAEIDDAQRAVRNTPWPVWLYPVNAVLFGLLGLASLLDSSSSARFAVALVTVVVNVTVGYRSGVPWALPTSRVFLVGVFGAGAWAVVAAVAAQLSDRAWPVVLFSLAATVTFSVGAIAHRRATA